MSLLPAEEAERLERLQEKIKNDALQHLLQANGISDDQLRNHPERVTRIEMVLDDYTCMATLSLFRKLKSVCLIQQAISKIEGLEECVELEMLLVNENRIQRIEGLHNCVKLKELNLCTNLIQDIGSSLKGLTSLQVLWLAENQLTSLCGLEHVPALVELNVSRNRLTTAVNAFEGNPKLRSVNLSDNKIGSFREVLELARHVGLRELSFADPDWGENPICQLCNYNTFILYHLPQLQLHDRMRVGDEEHLAAQSAFGKKSLYYNMRMKLIKRQAADGLRIARGLDEERVSAIHKEIETLAKVLKHFSACALARKMNPSGAQPSAVEAGEGRDLSTIERRWRECRIEVADAAVCRNALLENVQAEKEELIRGLLMELQTGGNIRMEAGCVEKDSWARHIAELVRSRFRPEEFEHFGVADIRVTQVTRIHNRSLRIRFEEALETEDIDCQKDLEYLFYVPDPRRAAADIRKVTEDGFVVGALDAHRVSESSETPQLLTNSIAIAESCRMESCASSEVGQAVSRALQRASRRDPADSMSLPPRPPATCGGKLLVCSVCVLHQQPDLPACFDCMGDVRDQWLREPSGTMLDASAFGVPESKVVVNSPRDDAEGGPRVVFRTSADDSRQKVWHTSQPEGVLPEFLVEYDLVYASELIQTHVQPKRPELGPLGGLFRDYFLYAQLGLMPAQKNDDGSSSSPRLIAQSVQLPELPELMPIEVVESSHVMSQEPKLLVAPDFSVLRQVQVLNLHGRGIRRIESCTFNLFPELKALLLTFNAIESVSWLSNIPTVTHLDLSFNLIQQLSILQGPSALKHLDLAWNQVSSMEAVDTLARDASGLESLNLIGNQLMRIPNYRATLLRRLRCLKALDEREVSRQEAQARERDVLSTELSFSELAQHSFSGNSVSPAPASTSPATNSEGPSLPPKFVLDPDRNRISILLDCAEAGGIFASSRITRSSWPGKVQVVDLRGLGLTHLCDLSSLTDVRRMQLGQNQLQSLDKVIACVSLEELELDHNGLCTLKGISSLVNLRRLDVAGNQLSDVLDVSKLPRLRELSLEDNFIEALDVFVVMKSIVELFLSNNLVEELRSVLLLKQLPKLIVLDLSGNELCQATDYRHYTIFHLRKLKVVDGIPITQAEHHEAEDKFSGKITMELLEDKLGPSPAYYTSRVVDLSGQNLKELGNIINDDLFPSLRELTLDNNPFSDIRSVGPCSKLLALRLNKSKLDLEKGTLDGSEDGGGLGSMPHIQVLEVANSGVTDMSHFSKLPLATLRILHLQDNAISRVEGLSHLEHLRELVLDRNKVKLFDEHSFDGLKSLRELRVEDNGLKSLDHLGPLPRLRALYLSLNRIGEFSELEKLRNLRHVLMIHLANNPVARKPLYRAHVINNVGTVRAIDGKEVTDDEREKVEQLLAVPDPTKLLGQGVYVFTDHGQGNQPRAP
eukprot:TRINITY_DN55439_c0_g1_i1.p1 TRINITY_DN55439_c0_g1~~TRINITY_DN55439_c0_g1_i1.p1  ORF type:complete len:1435 (-),score=232.12 TRINITY_DN55439_c0_g1_i1:221-4525(-)